MQAEDSFILEASPKAYECDIASEANHVQIEIAKHFSSTTGVTKHPQWVKLQSFTYRKGSLLLLTRRYYNF